VLRESIQYLAGNKRLRRTTVSSPLARRLAARFVAGETLQQAVQAIRETNRLGMHATLDHLGENVTYRDAAEGAATSYIAALAAIAANNLDANISCKLTSLGLDLGTSVVEDLLARVTNAAAEHGNFVRIDMEGSAYTQATLDITRRAFSHAQPVGAVIQSCLYRSSDDVRDLNRLGIRIRLVKGAYLEPASVAYPHKRDVDENYDRLAALMLADATYPAFATHDQALIDLVKHRASRMGRKQDDFEFQMLYGIRRDLQRELRDQGYRVRLYIPYGTEWYPYLMRRMAERPANLLFIVSSLAREAGGR